MSTQKIRTFLWFDNQAEEAVHLYVSLFKDSKVANVVRYGEGGPGPAGSVMTITFELAGVQFVALNGGPHFKFTEAISLTVDCHSQAEIDTLWEKLSAGGSKGQCGWLKDQYGLSWQIVPSGLAELLGDKDPAKSKRVVAALMQMTKLDLEKLKQAHSGK